MILFFGDMSSELLRRQRNKWCHCLSVLPLFKVIALKKEILLMRLGNRAVRTVVMRTRGRVTERATFIYTPLKKIKHDVVADLLLGFFWDDASTKLRNSRCGTSMIWFLLWPFQKLPTSPPAYPPSPPPRKKKKKTVTVQGEPEPCASVALHCGRGEERSETCLVIPKHHVQNTRAKVPQAIAALSFLYFRTMSDSVVPVNVCIVVLPGLSMGDRSAVRPRNLSSLIKGFVGDWERARCGRWEDNHTVCVFFHVAAGILETPDFLFFPPASLVKAARGAILSRCFS